LAWVSCKQSVSLFGPVRGSLFANERPMGQRAIQGGKAIVGTLSSEEICWIKQVNVVLKLFPCSWDRQKQATPPNRRAAGPSHRRGIHSAGYFQPNDRCPCSQHCL
jgi:hypothetical protein